MKKLVILFLSIFLFFNLYSQVNPVGCGRIPNATTNFGSTVPYGFTFINQETNKTYKVIRLNGFDSDKKLSDYILDTDYKEIPYTDALNLKATMFPGLDETTPVTVSVNYTTRILTVTPTGSTFNIFTDGLGLAYKYTFTGAQNFPAFTNTSGLWYFYYDGGGNPITTQTAPNDFRTIAPIYRIVWNATLTGAARSVTESVEAHYNNVPGASHDWTHLYGTIWANKGFVLANNAITSGSPNVSGLNTCVGLTTGTNVDGNLVYTVTNSTGGGAFQQDLGETTAANLTTSNGAQMKIRYMDAGGLSYVLPATRFPFDFTGDIPNYITSSGVRTSVSNNYYFVYFIYAIQDQRNGDAIRLLSAPAQYTTLTNAEAVTWSTIQAITPIYNDNEVRPLYRLIFMYKSAYNAAIKGTVLTEVTDLRKAVVATTNATGSIPASSVTFVPSGNISSTNVQSLGEELDAEKFQKSGVLGGQTAIGGTGVTDVLNLQGTAGNGTLTSPAIQVLVGDNGTTNALTILNNGSIGVNKTPSTGYKFDINGFINSATTVNQNSYPTINASQTALTLRDGSIYTGTDVTMSTLYKAVKLTASAAYTMGDYMIRIKSSATLTNPTATITGYIYSDNGGVPGTLLATGMGIRFGSLTTSYQTLSVGTTYAMISGLVYWLVLKQSTAPTGGDIILDSDVSTDMGATSTNGTSWTNTTAELRYVIRGLNYIGVYGNSTNSYGVYGISTNYIGVYGISTNYIGVHGNSTNSFGVYGISTNYIGVYGISTNYIGVYGNSTNSYGVQGNSTNYIGVYGNSTNYIGVYGNSTNSYGVYGNSTNYIGVYGNSTNSYGGIFYQNGTLTTENASNTVLIRRYPVTNSTGSLNCTGNVLQITDNPTGTGTVSGSILSGSIDGTTRLDFNPRVLDGAAAVSAIIDTKNVLSTAGAKLFSLRNQGTEKMYVGFDGKINSNSTVTGTQLISNIAQGTAPLSVTSTTKVDNLNVSLLEGHTASYFAAASTITDTSLFIHKAGTETISGRKIFNKSADIHSSKNAIPLNIYSPYIYNEGIDEYLNDSTSLIIHNSSANNYPQILFKADDSGEDGKLGIFYNSIAIGVHALDSVIYNKGIGSADIAIGRNALKNTPASGDNANNIAVGNDVGNEIYSSNNTLVGYNISSQNMSTGGWNSIFGNNSFTNSTTGKGNAAIGNNCIQHITTGNYNLGGGSGAIQYATTSVGCVGLGYDAIAGSMGGNVGKLGNYNTGTGYAVFGELTYGSFNSGYGSNAGDNQRYAQKNSHFGSYSGYANDTIGGIGNCSFGYMSSGNHINIGNGNLTLGAFSGYGMTNATKNILIGDSAGYEIVGSNKLYIGTGDSTNTIIYSDMLKHRIRLNGDVVIKNKIYGELMGNSSTSEAVATEYPYLQNTNLYIPMLIKSDYSDLLLSDSLLFNPYLNKLYTNINGTAAYANKVDIDTITTGLDARIPFMASTGGNQKLYMDNTIKYNSGTETLTVPNLAGNATSSNKTDSIYINYKNDDDGYLIPFIGQDYYVYDHIYAAGMTYNPANNIISANLLGNVTGNASTSTTSGTSDVALTLDNPSLYNLTDFNSYGAAAYSVPIANGSGGMSWGATSGGINAKNYAAVVATSNVTQSGAGQTIDGQVCNEGVTVLCTGQTIKASNGAWLIPESGAWTRRTDMDTWAELYQAYIPIVSGTTYGGSSWYCTIPSSGTLGTTDITFTEFLFPSSIEAGNGLTKTGTTLSTNVDNSTIEIHTDTLRIKDLGITTAKLANSSVTNAKIPASAGIDVTKLQGVSGTTGAGLMMLNAHPAFGSSTGTSPFTVTSTTKVTNLNVDQLDGADLETTITNSDTKIPSSKAVETYVSNLNTGGLSRNIKEINHSDSPYTVLSTDYTLIINHSDGNVIINLPKASLWTGRLLNIKDITNNATYQGVIHCYTNDFIDNDHYDINFTGSHSEWSIQSTGKESGDYSWIIISYIE